MAQIDPSLWGFASMFAWGVSDMLARYASIRIGSHSTAMAIQSFGIVPPLMVLLFRDSPWSTMLDVDFVVLVVVCSMLLSVGYVAFYRGLERGMISIVSPLSAGYLVVTTILTAIFFDEVVSSVGWMLIFVILIGIALTSSSGRIGASVSGVWYGLTAMMMMGVAFALWKPIVEDVGPFLAVLSVRLLSTVFLGIYLIIKKPGRLSFSRGTVCLLISAGISDSLGFISFNLGIELHKVSLIIPIAAAYPVVTIVMAWVLIRERLPLAQMLGIVTVLCGVIVFSAVI